MTYRFKESIGFQTEPEVENEWVDTEAQREDSKGTHTVIMADL